MSEARLHALSPLDGRYAAQLADVAALFSEAALIRYRVRVEARWLAHLAGPAALPELAGLPDGVSAELEALAAGVDEAGCNRVKAIEARTNHDVKAVEYFVRERLAAAGATPAQLEFVHFACTSEDINNLCHALMLRDARELLLLPLVDRLIERGLRTLEPAAAKPLWAEFTRRVQELQPVTFLFWSDDLAGVGPRLQDVVTDARSKIVNIDRWWIPEGRR